MKVRDLIEKLKAEPQGYEVTLGDDYRTYAVVDLGDTLKGRGAGLNPDSAHGW